MSSEEKINKGLREAARIAREELEVLDKKPLWHGAFEVIRMRVRQEEPTLREGLRIIDEVIELAGK